MANTSRWALLLLAAAVLVTLTCGMRTVEAAPSLSQAATAALRSIPNLELLLQADVGVDRDSGVWQVMVLGCYTPNFNLGRLQRRTSSSSPLLYSTHMLLYLCCARYFNQHQDQSDAGRNATPTSGAVFPSTVWDVTSHWGQAFAALRFDGLSQGLCAATMPFTSTSDYTCFVVDRAEQLRHVGNNGASGKHTNYLLVLADTCHLTHIWKRGISQAAARCTLATVAVPSPHGALVSLERSVASKRVPARQLWALRDWIGTLARWLPRLAV